MTQAPAIPVDAAEALLARLAGRDVTFAEHIHDCALATEDTHEVTELAKAYRYIARSARQSIALHAQLKQGRETRERAAAAAAPPPAPVMLDEVRVERRKAEVREAVRRIVWDETEAESLDEEVLLSVLDNHLRVTGERPDFTQPDLDDHIIAVCAALRLPLAKARGWRDFPDLPDRSIGGHDWNRPDLEDTG